MASDGQVVFEVVGDTSKVEDSIKKVTETIKTESKKWDDDTKGSFKELEKSAEDSESVIKGIFEGVAVGVTSAIINATASLVNAFAEWAAASIDVAANLEQIQGVVDTTFGEKGAEKIAKWAETTGSRFGMARLESLKLASSMGVLLKTSGLSSSEITDMSTSLTGLAADMGAFLDMDTDKAFDKIKSAMEGNASALKDLGISMKGADFDTFYASLGMDGKFGDLATADQYLVRYQYILEKMSDINGQYAREFSGTHKGRQDQIDTYWDRLQENLGEMIMPIADKSQQAQLSILKWLTGDNSVMITGTMEQLTQWLEQENQKIEAAKSEIDSIAAQWAEGFNMEFGEYDTNLYGSYGEYFYETLRAQQPFAGGKQRERIDSILAEMDAAYKQIGESEAAVADFQAQLNQLVSETPDTTSAGSQAVSDFVAGMNSQIVSVQSVVDMINDIVSSMGSVGVGTPNAIPQHEAGLNYVPFDGYLASLHEGEGILTAEENRIWQRFRNGQPDNTATLDSLLGNHLQGVKAGGNVYLDGRKVGDVVSARQGQAYRSLQRSGWQG